MPKLKFENKTDVMQHECESYRDGDWIVYKCQYCPEYERRINWHTGETKVKNGKTVALHTGSYFPHELKDVLGSLN